MKLLRILVIVAAVAALVSPLLRADVYEANNTPCTTKIVMVKQYTFQNGWLVSCPTWEAPLAYGATLSITDYTHEYYVPDQWGNLQYQSYEVRFESQYSYSVAANCPQIISSSTQTTFARPFTGYNPLGSVFPAYTRSETITGSTPSSAISAIATRIEQLTGQPLSEWHRGKIYDHGCVDVARVLSRTTSDAIPGYHYPERTPNQGPSTPNSKWTTKAYKTYAQAQAASCGGDRTLIYAVTGPWVGSPPVPTSTGEVPVTSIYPQNYIVRMPGNQTKWFGVSHGNKNLSTPVPQEGYVYDSPPPDENYIIFVRVCIHD
jgi:hypothetical protein